MQDDPLGNQATAPVIPPPPTAGQETDVLHPQNVGAAPTQDVVNPQPAPAPKPAAKQLPSSLPPYQAALEPMHSAFDAQQYISRTVTAINSFKSGYGAAPTAAVTHDLVRSGLLGNSITETAADMAQKAGQGVPSSPDIIKELDSFNELTPEEKARMRRVPVISVPNAVHKGVLYDPVRRAYLVNQQEPGSENDVIHQLKKGITPVADAWNFINQVRQTNPAAVAGHIGEIAKGDIAGAALKLSSEVGGTIGNVAKATDIAGRDLRALTLIRAQTAANFALTGYHLDQDLIGKLYDHAKNALSNPEQAKSDYFKLVRDNAKTASAAALSFGLNAGVGLGLININQDEHIGIGPNANPNTQLGRITTMLNEVISGKHLGSTSYDPAGKAAEEYASVRNHIALLHDSGQLSDEQFQAALGSLHTQYEGAVNTGDIDKALNPLERAKSGFEATAGLVSMATPQTLLASGLQAGTTKTLLDYGVNQDIATLTGDIVGIAALGKNAINLKGLGKAGLVEKIGFGAGAIGGGLFAADQTQGMDPLEKGAAILTGALMGGTGARHLGGQIDSFRASRIANKQISLALDAQNGDKVALDTLKRQADLSGKISLAQTEANKLWQESQKLAPARTQLKGGPQGALTPEQTTAEAALQAKAKPAQEAAVSAQQKAFEDRHIQLAADRAQKTGQSLPEGRNAQLLQSYSDRISEINDKIATSEEDKVLLNERNQVKAQLDSLRQEVGAPEATLPPQSTIPLTNTTSFVAGLRAQLSTSDWVDAVQGYVKKQTEVDKLIDRFQKQVEGDVQTPLRKAGDANNTLFNSTVPTDAEGHAIFNYGSKLVNAGKILSDSVTDELTKVLGGKDSAEKQAAFNEALWHPEVIPNIIWPDVRQAVVDMQAIFADRATMLPENMKAELIDNYRPIAVGKRADILTSILSPDTPLRQTTGHELERAPNLSEEEQRAAEVGQHPADAVREYLQETHRAQVNRVVRQALAASIRPDGTRAFIPEAEIGTLGLGRAQDIQVISGHKYVWSGAAGMTGLVDAKIAPALDALGKAGSDVGLGYRAFTSAFKQLAMKSPVHPWNQASAGIGVDINVGNLVKEGMSITGNDAQVQEYSKFSNLGAAEQTIYDMSDHLVVKNPFLGRIVDQLRSVNKQVFGHYDHIVWTSYIRNLQAGIVKTLAVRAMAAGAKYEDAMTAAGHFGDEITGKLDPNMLSRTERWLQRYLFFAYAWNRKHITIPAEAISPVATRLISPWLTDEQSSLVTNMAREYIVRQQANAWMMHTIANLALSGHPPWENQKGRELDLETTRLAALLAKIEGKPVSAERSYIQNGFNNFGNWYWKKGQIASDFGGDHVIQGLMQNMTDLSAPIPAFLATTAASLPYENLQESIGRGIQTLNPLQRNIFGPLESQQLKEQQGKVEKPQSAAQWIEDQFSHIPVFVTGLQTYQGERKSYTPTQTQLRDDKGVALELARMGIDPHYATADQVAKAKQMYQDASRGAALGELGQMAKGAPAGTGSHYQELTNWLSTQIEKGVLEQGITQAQYDKAIREGVSPFKLLDSTHSALLFKVHPEIGYALNAPSSNADPVAQRVHMEVVGYNEGLAKILTANKGKQDQYDAEYQAGTLKLSDWIKQTQALRTADSQAFTDLQVALSPAALAQVQKPPSDVSPLLPAETAYWNFRKIAYSDPKFQDANGVTNVKLYKAAQQAYLDSLPTDQKAYIENRELQSQTDLVKQYLQASTDYNSFRDANTQWEQLRTVYDSLTPFEKKLYRAANPELDGYLTYRENWFATDPQGQSAAQFFHLTDQKAFEQETTQRQASDMAEWFIDSWGSAKQQSYLTPWQKQVVSGGDLYQQLTANWSQTDANTMNAEIAAYYQQEAQYKANEHAYISNLLNKIFHHTGKLSTGTGSVLGG